MNITKLGHCCLLIKENGLTILTDPGTYSELQNEVTGIDVVLITHEHQDHLHIPSLKKVLENNEGARVICNDAVAKLLDAEGIPYELMAGGASQTVDGVAIEAFEEPHAEIYKDLPRVPNTGFFIASKLLYPGDAYIEPGKPVEILALPVAGPWLKISETIDYCIAVNPKVAFPVHDGILKVPGLGHMAPSLILPKHGISFQVVEVGESKDL